MGRGRGCAVAVAGAAPGDPITDPGTTCGSPFRGCAAPCARSRGTSPRPGSPRRRWTPCWSATSPVVAGSRAAPPASRTPVRPAATSAAPRWWRATWTPCTLMSGSTRPAARRPGPVPAVRPPRRGPATHCREAGASAEARRTARPRRLDRRRDRLHAARPTGGRCVTGATRPRIRGRGGGVRRLAQRAGHPVGRVLGPPRLEPAQRPPAGPRLRPVRHEGRPVRRRQRARRGMAGRAVVPRHAARAAGQVRHLAGAVLGRRRSGTRAAGARATAAAGSTTSATPPAATTTTCT